MQDWRARIAKVVQARADGARQPFVLGLCGPQGSGKSTAATVLRRMLVESGLSCAVLSIDDLYLTRTERQTLAATVHPLLATRGPPGTHDVKLGASTIEALGTDSDVRLPRFDKGRDDRARTDDWPYVRSPIEVLIFEGWCVGAVAQPPEDLIEPVNDLERNEDREGVWRTYVNHQLAGPYQTLFGRIDYLAVLRPPAFEQVLAWRTQQEDELRQAGGGPRVMSAAQLARFIQHYERLTRWIDREMPARAQAVIEIDADRNLRKLTLR